MREDLKILEKIDQYLSGQMNNAELGEFKKEIKNNTALKNKVENQKLIIQAVKRQALSNQINAIAKGGSFFNYKWIISGLLILSLLTVLYWQFNPKHNTNTNQDYVKRVTELPVNNKNKTQKNEDVIIDSSFVEEVVHSNNNKTAHQANTVSKKPKNIKKEVKDQTNQFNFYDFNGLKCWEKPNIQTFKINANETSTIEGENGTLIIIAKNSLLNQKGKRINGAVNFELIEAYDLSDMIMYNLTTLADNNMLETGGMFYLNATQNGKPLKVNPSKPMLIQVPCENEKPNMMAFESEIDANGDINWKNPKRLEKWLTKIDMKLLDYLPSGFENEVYANAHILGNKKVDEETVNNLYYSFGYERNSIGNIELTNVKKYSGVGTTNIEDNFVLKPKEKVKCGVHPISIQHIKTNQGFYNSFIATKEFEARLKLLHKAKNGQEMLDVYLANLDKNLFYSDSIVANKIIDIENTVDLKNEFLKFYNQKKTKVKYGDEYANALSQYYNQKREAFKKEIERIKKLNRKALASERKKLQKIKNSNRKTSKSNVSRVNNYTMAWAAFGWANIDSYLHLLEKGSENVEISCEKSNHKGRLKIYQWLGAISTLTPIIVNQLKGIVKVPKKGNKGWLKMQNVYTIALSKYNDQWFLGTKKYNPYQQKLVEVNLTKVTGNVLKQKINQLKGGNTLVKDIESQEKELVELNKKMQKQLKEKEFLNKLESICFSSCSQTKNISKNNAWSPLTVVTTPDPSFPGGDSALNKFIDENFNFPDGCKIPKGKNTIYVSFIVNIDGSISNEKIVRGINDCLNQEALRVVNLMPKWNPAMENGKPIKTEYQLPIKVITG